MKALFIGVNLCFGCVCAILGIASILYVVTAAYNLAYGFVGVIALLMAAVCLRLACDCRSDNSSQPT